MLSIYHSNRLETLGKQLADRLRQRPTGRSLFEPDTIVVQNPDMAQWLKLSLAQDLGIAANLEFPLPSNYLWSLYMRLIQDKVPDAPPFEKGLVLWKLMLLLPDLLTRPSFAPLQRYLASSGGSDEQLRRLQLCRKIADVFDQYLVYRPEWISEWERGEVQALDQLGENRWQAELWQALSELTQALEATPYHRSNLYQFAIEALNQASFEPRALPPRLFLFGLSTLPRPMVHLLDALARHCPVHLFLLNPCQEFWSDIVSDKTRARLDLQHPTQDQFLTVGNPLLASMGQLCRDFHALVQEETSPGHQQTIELFEPPEGAALLPTLQREVLELRCRGQFDSLTAEQLLSNAGKYPLPADDDSIRLHSCYTPLREVEVLHDQLLACLERDPGLEPRDILVMSPNIEAYAPYIDAVFGSQPMERQIPYAINDLSSTQESPLLASFLRLLALPDSRLALSEVLSLLETPAILARFELSEQELETLKAWLQEAGVRWGRDGQHRAAFGLPGFEQNSWAFGLRRLLLGYAMQEHQGLFKGEALPYDGVEGKQAEALGKLLLFIDRLDEYQALLSAARPADEWQVVLSGLIEAMFHPQPEEQLLLNRISQQVQTLTERLAHLGWQEALTRDVMLSHLSDALNRSGSNPRFMAGALNCCTLIPMRSIPFRMICLLGMNDGDFPRSTPPVGFDLMADDYRKGDRSRRLDDRYLFLEALLSARERLYISYLGRHVRNDQECAPSTLVSEMLDYLQQVFVPAGLEDAPVEKAQRALLDHLVIHHPLQPYNRAYLDGSSPALFTYAAEWEQAHQAVAAGPGADAPLADYFADDTPPHVVTLAQLAGFLTHPCKQFMQRRLGAYLQGFDEQAQESEPFALNALEKWQIKDHYLTLLSSDQDQRSDAWTQNLRYRGTLPAFHHGQLLLAEQIGTCDAIAKALDDWLTRPAEKQVLELNLGDWRLSGEISGLLLPDRGDDAATEPGVLRILKAGSAKAKDLLRAWVYHLALNAAGQPHRTLLIAEGHVHFFLTLTVEEAEAQLLNLLDAYRQGLSQPLPFFPQTSQAYLKALEPPKKSKQASGNEASEQKTPANALVTVQNAVLKTWQPAFGNGAPAESEDPYNRRCFADLLAVWEPFTHWAERLLQPMQGQLQRKTYKQFRDGGFAP